MAGRGDRGREGVLVSALPLPVCAQKWRRHICSCPTGQSRPPGHVYPPGPGGCRPTINIDGGRELKSQRMAIEPFFRTHSKAFCSYVTRILFLMQLGIGRGRGRHHRPTCPNPLKPMRLCPHFVRIWIVRVHCGAQECSTRQRSLQRHTFSSWAVIFAFLFVCLKNKFTLGSSLVDCTPFRYIILKWCMLPAWSKHKVLDISIHPKEIKCRYESRSKWLLTVTCRWCP